MTSHAPSMDPDRPRLPDDEIRVPAAALSHMERDMMQLLDRAQKAADSGTMALVRGLRVMFSLKGDAVVTWEFHGSADDPAP